MSDSAAFACMQAQNQSPLLRFGPSLWSPPMKTWMENVAEELGCKPSELCLCRSLDEKVERWWWELLPSNTGGNKE